MSLEWSLKELYPSFEAESYQQDFQCLQGLLDEIEIWINRELNNLNNPREKMEDFINLFSKLNNNLHRLYAFSSLSLSVAATNRDALQSLNKLEKIQSKLTKVKVTFVKWLGQLENLEEIIQGSKLLEDHAFFLIESRNKNKYLLTEGEEVILSKMSNTGSKAWSKLQDLLISTLTVPIEVGREIKELPLATVRNMAYDADPQVRKISYERELEAYKQVAEASAAALNGIKGEVITEVALRGYKSPLDKTLVESRMDEEILNVMLEAMKESLPSFHRFYRKKAALLGHKNGLPFYDLFAPMGRVNKIYTYEEATAFVIKHFRSFSDSLADYAAKAIENNWIDVEPRKGKRGGAFCFNLHPIKESRFLLNFTGSFGNVSTLAHELGHGYHGACLVDDSILNTSYPMPLAETASIFAETIITNAAIKDATQEEAFSILESAISHSGQIIVDIYSRYLFETALFKERENYTVSVEKLNEFMIEAQKEAYGDGLNHEYLHQYMWITKPHYYSADRNFYNFPYAFGLLFGLGIYSEYLKQREGFVEAYDELLKATGKNTIKNVAKMAGIDITSKSFWKGSLEIIEKDIEKFIQLSDKIFQ